ncbi:PaaX family transcriptional regulator [Pseudomonas sp. LS44]|uniref:PaaX family transcriptional regulator C-terminal domain-containing protein n=1 Tax=Pseudomonas sp. LS44 TaxID=1357074 RepID=UPI00215A3187|nr:PaaX family transcriptional regulator C-terminal domain-containing protein [Pseudomonas sp. LS44]UVE19328.1 PaaX family transcriptional regulator [Pseudomonas sp. LS44]
MQPTAKSLILELLLAAQGVPLTARDAVVACGLFEINASNARVALVRLSAAGLIEAAGRGSYQLSEQARELGGDIATWREIEQRLRPWDGSYVLAQCGALGRTDRGALRRRERALELLGFRELERGLYLRPNNLEPDLAALRQRIHGLGLESAAYLFRADGFDADCQARIDRLWNTAALLEQYRQLSRQMRDWLARVDDLETDVAAREAFLFGSRAIRQVVFDPLLPAPMIDEAARAAFFTDVREFDRIGHQLWQRFYRSTPPLRSGSREPTKTTTRSLQ